MSKLWYTSFVKVKTKVSNTSRVANASQVLNNKITDEQKANKKGVGLGIGASELLAELAGPPLAGRRWGCICPEPFWAWCIPPGRSFKTYHQTCTQPVVEMWVSNMLLIHRKVSKACICMYAVPEINV